MNEELKEQAHKEFDKTLGHGLTQYGHKKVHKHDVHKTGCTSECVYLNQAIKSFIDSLIDRTVQMERERIVEVIEESKDGSDGDVALDYVIKLIKRK